MQQYVKTLLLVAAAILIPFLPFVGFGDALDERIEGWLEEPPDRLTIAAAVAGILATDIFLPIPSSTVSAIAGHQLGTWLGTAASWLGMTVGAVLGFVLARRFGRPLAEWLAGKEELERIGRITARTGPLVLVLTRAVPLMAEASVLLLGATGLTWRRFLFPVAASNLGIALAYSAVGEISERYQFLPFALAVSIALPVLLTISARRWLPSGETSFEPEQEQGQEMGQEMGEENV